MTTPDEAQKYREWRAWAIREVADAIITEGFQGIGGTLDRIVHAYLHLPNNKGKK